jgi:hypothetical protein
MIDAVQLKTIYLDMSTLRAHASELGDAWCLLDGWLIASQQILSCGNWVHCHVHKTASLDLF